MLRDTNRLSLRPRPGLQRILHDEIHAAPQTIFDPELETHVLGQSRSLTELNQDVYVAVRSRFVSRHRAKQCERADAESLHKLLPVEGEKAEHLIPSHGLGSSGRSWSRRVG